MTVVLMGVAGSGKSTVMAPLAARLRWRWAEADDFHTPANVAKMSAGHPLSDDDRWPWLRAIANWIAERERAGENAVVTCSALRREYRDFLRNGHPSTSCISRWTTRSSSGGWNSDAGTTCRRRCLPVSSTHSNRSIATSPGSSYPANGLPIASSKKS